MPTARPPTYRDAVLEPDGTLEVRYGTWPREDPDAWDVFWPGEYRWDVVPARRNRRGSLPWGIHPPRYRIRVGEKVRAFIPVCLTLPLEAGPYNALI